ncbi:WXG100 family type VII secretion target [Nocardia salmonicida]|uniref:WXG100 family type VII secretion target n=1 Tax=Nocardia salmonicida TaxID=53431 RepID=UPI0007A44338|nr:WXG100 family type VII secretion target [Nocardia salmonicida]
MASNFTVDLDHLDIIVAKLAGLSGYINDHLDDVDDQVVELLGTGWESVAADAYQTAHQKWAAGAREFVEGIRDMSDAAKAAHGGYTSASDLNKRMLRGG